MTKEQIVRFAARHLCDNYVAAYKRKGEDTNFKAIEKPVITPLPINRDTTSVFMQAILDSKVPPIAPRFIDFDRDIVRGTTSSGLPYAYVKNTENGRFELMFRYDIGNEANPMYNDAAEYLKETAILSPIC